MLQCRNARVTNVIGRYTFGEVLANMIEWDDMKFR